MIFSDIRKLMRSTLKSPIEIALKLENAEKRFISKKPHSLCLP